MLRRLAFLIVLVLAGVAWYLALPPPRRPLPPPAANVTAPVRGAFHVHTRRSDGTGTVDQVASAAARAGLQFVLVTDHGDGTREVEPPRYRDGVLTIDSVEISTRGGHVVALDVSKAPYPLAGEARDVLDDIDRLGGFSIAAHPGSEKAELRWTDWTHPAGGLEWINADSEWRDERAGTLVHALFTYPFRPVESLAMLLDRPDPVLRQWDAETRRRRVVALAAADAHARIGLRTVGEPYDNSPRLPMPGYERSFRLFSITLPDVMLTGDAGRDARAVVDAIRRGHVYSTVDALAGPAAVTFTAQSGKVHVSGGDALAGDAGVTLHVGGSAPPDAETVLFKNGDPILTTGGGELRHTVDREAAVYRIEIRLPGAPGNPAVPWIVTNPIYVGRSATEERVRDTHARPTQFAMVYENGPATGWTVEKGPLSDAALDVVGSAGGGSQLLIRYAVGGSVSMSPYAAFIVPAGPALPKHDRLVFNARADGPMRMSVQFRLPNGSTGERWQRSVYLDATPRDITIYFDEMTAVEPTESSRPELSNVRDVLFVVDTVNTKPGTSGQLWLDNIRYAR